MPELLAQGLTLAAYGMGTVFTFLSLLVGATALMSKSVNHFSTRAAMNETFVAPLTGSQPSAKAPGGDVTPEILAVITGAITTHRLSNRSRRENIAEIANNK